VEVEDNLSQQFDFSQAQVFIYRAVQELLFNAAKHAKAKTTRVAITTTGADILITVSDDGEGFNMDSIELGSIKAGLGLMSLQERMISSPILQTMRCPIKL
jgi:signal transduction histidine kinase